MNRFALFLAMIAIAGALAVDMVAGDTVAPAPAPLTSPAGVVLACPAAVDGDARAFLHMANFGESEARVKVTLRAARGGRFVQDRTLAPGAVRTVRLHGRVKGRASAVVESSEEIVATHTLWYRSRQRTGVLRRLIRPTGGAGAPCASVGPETLIVPHLRTQGGDAKLVLFNPGSANAVVSVSYIVGNRIVRPERTDQRTIEARRSRQFVVGDSIFNAPEVTAVIQAENGRVVGEGLSILRRGVAVQPAVPASAVVSTLMGKSGRGSTLGIAGPGEVDTGIAASVIGRQDQGRAPGIPTDLGPGNGVSRTTKPVDGGGPAAFTLETTVGGPLAAGGRWALARRGQEDIVASSHQRPTTSWGVAFGSPIRGTTARILIVNPGEEPATIRIRRLGGDGAEDLSVPPGRMRIVPLGSGTGPRAAQVTADVPIIAMLEAGATAVVDGRRTTYGFGIEGVPAAQHVPLPVSIEPRAGVPAREGG